MAFKQNQTNGNVTFTEGYQEPAMVTTTSDQNPAGFATYSTFDPKGGEFTEGKANLSNTWIDPKTGEVKLLLRPINWQLVCDELINGGSYSLSDLGSTVQTTIDVTVSEYIPKDGSKDDSETNVNKLEPTSLNLVCVKSGANVWGIDCGKEVTVKITPDSDLLESINPVVDVDGKYSDYKVLANGITFTSNKNHRINIHWSADCVETFYFVAKL